MVKSILEKQAGKLKEEIAVCVDGALIFAGDCSDPNTGSEHKGVWSRFARSTSKHGGDIRSNSAESWATAAKRAERDIRKLVKKFSDEEE